MCSYLKDNLNWIIPLFITTAFSIVTIVFSVLNYRIVKQQRELQNDSFCFQLFDRRLNVYTSIKEIISDADIEYEETDRDEYFIGFLRQKLTELGYIDKVKITVEHEFFSAYMVY